LGRRATAVGAEPGRRGLGKSGDEGNMPLTDEPWRHAGQVRLAVGGWYILLRNKKQIWIFYFNLFPWHWKELKLGKNLEASKKYKKFLGGRLNHLEQLSC
jgi:hypothetical protein